MSIVKFSSFLDKFKDHVKFINVVSKIINNNNKRKRRDNLNYIVINLITKTLKLYNSKNILLY